VQKITRLAVIIMVVGISIVVGTVYRSDYMYSGGNDYSGAYGLGLFSGFEAHTWNPSREGQIFSQNYWAPRDLRIDLTGTSTYTIDLYVLDSQGLKTWVSEGTLEPVFEFKNVSSADSLTMQLPRRESYTLLAYNPTDKTIHNAEIRYTIHGPEYDLLWISITLTTIGATILVASLALQRKRNKKPTFMAPKPQTGGNASND